MTVTPNDRALFDWLKAQSVVDAAGCWIWTGSYPKSCKYPSGHHGLTRVKGKSERAHRAMWIAVHGFIPAGLNILHKCDVPKCINPDHLWPGTQLENVQDMVAKGRHVGKRQAAASHCRNGHERNDENCYVDSRGGRGCLICQRAAGARYHQRQVERGLYRLDIHYASVIDGCCVAAITKRQNLKATANLGAVTCKVCLISVARREFRNEALAS